MTSIGGRVARSTDCSGYFTRLMRVQRTYCIRDSVCVEAEIRYTGLTAQHSLPISSLRQRLSHAMERSTIQIGRISIAKASHSCTSPQFGSCSENSAIQPKASGQTLSVRYGLPRTVRHRTVRTKGSLSTAKLIVFQARDCRIKHLAAAERNKSFAEDHRRCQIHRRHRGHPSAANHAA
jgi:hypothetical protein